LEDLGGQKRVDLPTMAMKKNSESNLNEMKSEYNQQKVLESDYSRYRGYAALNGQLKHPVGPTGQFALRGSLAIADIPGA
jgi:hypothetical protein